MAKKLAVTNLPVIYMKEGDTFICYSPAFDLVAHGDSFEDAEESFAKALKLFIQEVTRKGTWEKVLREYGWEKVHREWCPPRVIGQENVPVELLIAV